MLQVASEAMAEIESLALGSNSGDGLWALGDLASNV